MFFVKTTLICIFHPQDFEMFGYKPDAYYKFAKDWKKANNTLF